MNTLVLDIGGTHVKVATNKHLKPIKIPSGPELTPQQMVDAVLAATDGWSYDRITLGFPGPVQHGQPMAEPHNLGTGWVGFDFGKAFGGKPHRFINDAAMQALGDYAGGRMLFLGVGTGLGSAMVIKGLVVPLELAHLPYKKGRTFEEYVGLSGLQLRGKKRWRKSVLDVIERLRAAMVCDHVVLGGGNAKLMKALPEHVVLGANTNAIKGGIRLWDMPEIPAPKAKPLTAPKKKA
ncbi:MAG TPA: ROK family protein [Granulicella sp.]